MKINMYNYHHRELSQNEGEIAKIQSIIKEFGYQWQEHQFNDGYDEVYIELTKDNNPNAIDNHTDTIGWGRFGRLTAWRMALEHIIKINKN